MLAGCVSVRGGISEAERECTRLFRKQGLNVKNKKDKWSKREYIHCVSNLANAKQIESQANATKGLLYTQWVSQLVVMALILFIIS